MIKVEGGYTSGESGWTGGLVARRSIYFSTEREFALCWAFAHRVAEYPRVLPLGEMVKAVVLETPLIPMDLAFVNGSQSQLDVILERNSSWVPGSGLVLPPPVAMVVSGWGSADCEAFEGIDVRGSGRFMQVVAVASAGEIMVNQEQSLIHMVNIQIGT